MSALRRRRRRGQATVEMAVLCIVLVPLFMYVIFLDDLLRYKLELAEGVFSAPWDYTTIDYQAGPNIGDVQHQIRVALCDHTTAYNSHDKDFECGDNHHVALAAHSCWLTKGAQQVRCQVAEPDMGQSPFGLALTSGVKGVNKGGQIKCSGRLGVINYFLPEKLFEQFSQVDADTGGTGGMTRADKKSGSAHTAGSGLAAESHYLLERQTTSILTDTWAMTTVEAQDPDENSGELYSRVDRAYPGLIAMAAVLPFVTQAVSDELLTPAALAPVDLGGLNDSVRTPQVGFSPAAPPKIGDFFSSPWNDNASNAVENAYNKRGSKYFGWTADPG